MSAVCDTLKSLSLIPNRTESEVGQFNPLCISFELLEDFNINNPTKI